MPIGIWIDHSYCAGKNSKIKAGNTGRVVPLTKFTNEEF